MKTLKLIVSMSILWAAASLFTACEQTLQEEEPMLMALQSATAPVEYCGEITTVDFLAGQHMQAGTVIVGNDGTNLYVTFLTIDGWVMKATHLYVGDGSNLTNKGGNPAPGQFPYKSSHKPSVTTFTYTIPLENVPACMTIAAHAEVEKVVDGNVVDSQTAWGNGVTIAPNKSWAMKFEFCQQECVVDEVKCYADETAWADGERYSESRGWAMYTQYDGEEKDVILYAGNPKNNPEEKEAGVVNFSAVVDGKVTLTITLKEGFIFQDVAEFVKIQGYTEAPYWGKFGSRPIYNLQGNGNNTHAGCSCFLWYPFRRAPGNTLRINIRQ